MEACYESCSTFGRSLYRGNPSTVVFFQYWYQWYTSDTGLLIGVSFHNFINVQFWVGCIALALALCSSQELQNKLVAPLNRIMRSSETSDIVSQSWLLGGAVDLEL